VGGAKVKGVKVRGLRLGESKYIEYIDTSLQQTDP